MESFSYTNPENGVSITIALIENGNHGTVVLLGERHKEVFTGSVEEARRHYAEEKQRYEERVEAEKV